MTSATPKPRAGEQNTPKTENDLEWAQHAKKLQAEAASLRGRLLVSNELLWKFEAERDLLRERERELVAALEWFVTGKGKPDLDGSIGRALLAKHGR
jgi:hypothetical protein